MVGMSKIRVAVVGYGNIGKFAVEAVMAAEDLELAGIVRREASVPVELKGYDIAVVDDVDKLGKVDVAILATPSRKVEETAKKYLAKGICTVDSFDIHAGIYDLKCSLTEAAKKTGAASINAAGWDPGSDSVVRALLEAIAPKGLTYTNFGPGMSMGHSVAARAIDGVENALSITIPLGTGIHRRMVYVKPKAGADFDKIAADLKADPYFSHDETHVIKADDIDALQDMGHGVNMVRKGVSGVTQNQLFEFNMTINNPALTAQVLASCARAAVRQKTRPGAYTMIEVPVIDMLPGEGEKWIRKLV